MSVTTVLFDLDGTLLPMDADLFVRDYLTRLARKLHPYGYEPQKLTEAVWSGTKAMVINNGKKSNETVFWEAFDHCFGYSASKDAALHMDFYRNEFQLVKQVCGYQPLAVETVRSLKDKGIRLILATNPVFPSLATESRIRWAGLQPEDFDYVTSFENSHFCKPNPDYYWEILEKFHLNPEECVMVGNDAAEDMVAESLGMRVFLLTDCLINKANADLSAHPQGDFGALRSFLKECLV